jgi:hypothetical protein
MLNRDPGRPRCPPGSRFPWKSWRPRTLLASAPYDYVCDLAPTYATNG